MISKNSFWASIRENNKRRIWLWLVSALTFVIAYPTAVAMDISRVKANTAYLIESHGTALGMEMSRHELLNSMKICFGMENYLLFAVAAAIAIISGIQGFSYLYSKRKIDFYMGMPVRRSRRFLIIWLNGILVWLIPYIVGTLLGILIAAGNGLITFEILRENLLMHCMLLGFYLGVYHLAILAVMLTGNVLITCFATAVFCLYELAVRILIMEYMSKFFKTFVYQDDFALPLLSPFAIYLKYAGKHSQGTGNGFMTWLALIGFAGAIGVIGYICYLKRPAEAAGKAMAFKSIQSLIKILLAVPVTLLSGCVVGDIVGYNPLWGEGKNLGFVIFTMVVVLIIICCLIQVIYEFDLRGILHKKHHVFIAAGLTAAIFLIFRYDVFGYDNYLPKVEKVSSAAIIPPYEYSYYGGDNYFDENLEYISKYEFIMDHMYLTDIGAVNKLLKKSNEDIADVQDFHQFYNDEDKEWYTLEVVYRQGGKRTVSRRVYVDMKDAETVALLDRIQSTDEYIDGIYIGVAENMEKILSDAENRATVFYGTNIYNQKLTKEEAMQLLALYQEDVRGQKLSDMRSNIPTGSLRLNVERKYETYTSYRESVIHIYPFYTKCVEYLKERGYYMDTFVKPEDVEKIQVTNYNFDLQQAMTQNAEVTSYDPQSTLMMAKAEEYGSEASEYVRNAVYEDKEKIAEICRKIYPTDWVSAGYSNEAQFEDDYSVTVYFKPEKSVDGKSIAYFGFLNGEIPEYVKNDTTY